MLKAAAKAVVAVTASVVAVPYTIALLANILYGFPQIKDKYKRAFHPKKVYALNFALLQQLGNLRYLTLLFRWKMFYSRADKTRLIKDIPFGSNKNSLDLYFPERRQPSSPEDKLPIVVFLYGGAWGSGDKAMYGLLCCELADRLGAMVCCPNYSLYPKGYVDDMVTDVIDCLTWLQNNAQHHRADKDRIMLVGHSAGGHLCAMAVLEIIMKRLLHNPQSVIMPESVYLRSVSDEPFKFEEKHFDGNSNGEGVNGNNENSQLQASFGQSINSAGSLGSFYVVDDNKDAQRASTSDSFFVVQEESGEQEASGGQEETTTKEVESEAPPQSEAAAQSEAIDSDNQETEKGEGDMYETESAQKDEGPSEAKDDSAKDTGAIEPTGQQYGDEKEFADFEMEDEETMPRDQKEIRDILYSIKAVIGLAGVYNISDHFEHESSRGVEDISAMGRAMYGPENFDRFSPTHIVQNLPQRTRLPPIFLIHGETDKTVPVSSSEKFGQAVYNLGSEASITLIPACGHTDVCLDLMDPERTYYDTVMGIVLAIATRCL